MKKQHKIHSSYRSKKLFFKIENGFLCCVCCVRSRKLLKKILDNTCLLVVYFVLCTYCVVLCIRKIVQIDVSGSFAPPMGSANRYMGLKNFLLTYREM